MAKSDQSLVFDILIDAMGGTPEFESARWNATFSHYVMDVSAGNCGYYFNASIQDGVFRLITFCDKKDVKYLVKKAGGSANYGLNNRWINKIDLGDPKLSKRVGKVFTKFKKALDKKNGQA